MIALFDKPIPYVTLATMMFIAVCLTFTMRSSTEEELPAKVNELEDRLMEGWNCDGVQNEPD